MANFPGVSWRIPSADPPYPIGIKKDGMVVLLTDNCGIHFEVLDDKQTAAIAYIEHAINDVAKISNHDYTHRIGAINFVVKNREIVDIKPVFEVEIPHVKHTPENRPEVLEMIELMKTSLKSMMKMKAFW